ncbi:MAG: hypothetical protein HY898_32025 [Deltaproteobacteria bacterium]|nr:hypothetical protein [Deltaproteobacteria bacterium]
MARGLRRFAWAGGVAARVRLGVALLAAFAALIWFGCKDKKPAPEPPPTAAVPPPAGLLADVFLTTPDVTWQRVRGKVGGPAALLPTTFPTLVVTLLGMPPQVAEQLDANLPAYGAVLELGPGGALDVVLAVHLRDEARVIETLTAGQEPRYTAKKDASGVLLIEPKVKSSDPFAAMGIANHYLIASKSPQALVAASGYVTRTLPTLPKPASELTLVAGHDALAGPIAVRIRAEWAAFKKAREKDDQELRQQHGGRAPDFGDPAAALADIDGKIRRLTEIMTDLAQARLEMNSDETGVHSRLAMVPQPGAGVASREIGALVVGDPNPVLELPAGSVVALLTRDSDEVRKAGAQDQVDGLAHVLGDRIAAEDRKKVGDVLEGWARGRGDWIVAGVEWTAESRALLVRGSVKDGATLDKAVEGMFELTKVPGLKDPIEQFAGKIAFGKPTTDGPYKTIHVQREAPSRNAETKKEGAKGDVVVKRRKGSDSGEFDVSWQIDPAASLFRILATANAKAWLAAESKAKPPTLGEDPEIANAVRALGNDSSFVFLFQPFKLMVGLTSRSSAQQKPSSAPVVFSYGRSKADGWFRLDLPYGVVAEVARGILTR